MAVLCGMPTINYSARSPTVWPRYTNVTDRQTGQQADRTDKQTDNGPIAQGEPFYKRSPKNQLIAKHDMTYTCVVSHLGFRRKCRPACSVPNHATIPTTTHFCYPALASSRNNSSSIPPVIRFLAIFLAYDVHRVSTKFAVRSTVISATADGSL